MDNEKVTFKRKGYYLYAYVNGGIVAEYSHKKGQVIYGATKYFSTLLEEAKKVFPNPYQKPIRDDHPMWMLRADTVQEIAMENIGRRLTNDELQLFKDNFEIVDWDIMVHNTITNLFDKHEEE